MNEAPGHKRKEACDAIANDCAAAVRRGHLLRTFQKEETRGSGDVRNGPADRGGLIRAQRVALILLVDLV